MTTKERFWEVEYLDRFCWVGDCKHEFKDGDDVYVLCNFYPDSYAGGCNLYCENHAPKFSALYKAKIMPPKPKRARKGRVGE